ncbi:T9SS type A sorting domain-containing protein [Saprospiraceae bacterium]|nr:T9SS type A sorting domain-containing protein [Saprospiraceae bacterium]
MNIRFTLSTIGLLFTMLVLMSNAGGRAAGAGEGNTGAPGDDAKVCATCHMGGNFGTNIAIEVVDASGNLITEYVPGTEYTVNATINTTTAPAGYGLQLVSLIDGTQADTEGLFFPSGNAQIVPLGNGRNYLEQVVLSSSEVFSAKWIAPAVASGSVTFYASGHAADGYGSTSGDEAALGETSLTEIVSAVDEFQSLGLTISPNPTENITTIKLENSSNMSVQLFDITGKKLFADNVNSDRYTLDLTNQQAGVYFLKVTDLDKNLFETRRVIKN